MKKKTLARRKKTGSRVPLGPVDPVLLHTLALLLGFGLVMVASASLPVAQLHGHQPVYYLLKSSVFLLLGVLAMVLVTRIPLDRLEQISNSLMLFAYILLLLVFVPGFGVEAKGGHRWVNLGLANFQVVELVKVMLILYFAGFLVREGEVMRSSLKGLFKPLGMVALLAVLLLAQPDFGSTVLVLGMTVLMLWLGGARIRDLLLLAVIALPPLAWIMVQEQYRVSRLTGFLDPWADPTNSGFQLIQALIAVGRGEWLGTGLGGSIQKLYYLPEAHTDFILAVIAEELGFVGVLVLIALYGVLIGRSVFIGRLAMEQGKPFVAYVCWGVAGWLGMQSLISMAVNVGLLPTKGLTLPLISAGGSSLIMGCVAMGLVLRASREVKWPAHGREVAHV